MSAPVSEANTDPQSLLQQRQALLPALFSGGVSLGACDPQDHPPAPFPEEAACLSPTAVDKRRREFAAGRAAAHQAMRASGREPCPILVGPKRAPLWPRGVVGTISHTRSFACAALASALSHRGIGLDVEEDTPLSRDLWPSIASEAEQAWMRQQNDSGQAGKLLFSAKEAAYKAQYCASARYFGFEGMELRFEMAKGRFSAQFTADQLPFHAGDTLKGRFTIAAGVILTAVEIPNHEPCA